MARNYSNHFIFPLSYSPFDSSSLVACHAQQVGFSLLVQQAGRHLLSLFDIQTRSQTLGSVRPIHPTDARNARALVTLGRGPGKPRAVVR